MNLKIIFFFTPLFAIIIISCYSASKESGLKNRGLPKEIKLSNKTTLIIDSSFRFYQNEKLIESVTRYELKNKILKKRNYYYFDKGVFTSSFTDKCGNNGNFIFSIFKNKEGKAQSTTYQKRDKYGYPIELKVIPAKGKKTIISIKNTYNNQRLVKVENKKKDGYIFESQNFKYNESGNIVEQSTNSFAYFLTQNKYDKNQNLILYKRFKNYVLADSIVYVYQNNRLKKESWYQQFDGDIGYPIEKEYLYNKKNHLIKEIGTFQTIEYTMHDSLGNWQIRKIYSNKTLQSISKRSFAY